MNKEKVSIKFIRKANQWCKTTITFNNKGEKEQKQEWFDKKPE